MSLGVIAAGEVKPIKAEPERKRVRIGRESVAIDPKPGELPMGRMKVG